MCTRRVLLAVLAVTAVSLAQNARTSALGGVTIIDDIARIAVNPADVAKYPDNIQATATGAAFGSVAGIKGLGENVVLGLWANSGSVLQSDFYYDAGVALDALSALPALGTTMPPVPHLLFGLDLGVFALGLDAFAEVDHAAATSEIDPPGSSSTVSKYIVHPGAVLSCNITLPGFRVSPLVGAGLPRTRGLVETDPGGGAAILRNEVETSTGFMVRGGVEVAFGPERLQAIIGGGYTLEKYQINTSVGGAVTEGPLTTNHIILGSVGIVAQLPADFLLATQYGLRIANELVSYDFGIPPNVVNTETSTVDITHAVGLGLERPIEGFWIFDGLIPRAGLSWYLYDSRTESIVDDLSPGGSATTTTLNPAATLAPVSPRLGLGITKGIFAFDVLLSFGNYGGVISGPAVVQGTFTLDFRKSPTSRSPSAGGATWQEPAQRPIETPPPVDNTGDTDSLY